MIGKALMIVSLALSLADGCGRPGSETGGDGNPSTGECEITYAETVGGELHRYPELSPGGLNQVVGKVIVTCQRPPKTHLIEAWLQSKKTGEDWKNIDASSNAHVPSPKETVFLRGSCDARAKKAFWRVKVHIAGTGVGAEGPNNERFDVDDNSPERWIECPK